MKKFLLFPLMAILTTNTYANNNIDTVKQIVTLAESGEIFNLTKTAKSLNLKDEIDKATYKPLADGNHIIYNFPINTHQVIKSISYRVSFGGLGNYNLSTVYKNVKITFKKEHCPNIDDLQTAFGEKLMATEAMGSPSLQTGQNGSRQGVRYDIRTSNQLIFVENNGCEFSVSGRADEFK